VMIVVMIAGLLILKIMNRRLEGADAMASGVRRTETVYVTNHIYRSTAIGMKYFLNSQTRRKAMTKENNTIPNTTMIINHFRWISTVFLIV
jgi:hypothetical protein